MAKRSKDEITLGSGKVFVMPFTGTMPTVDSICTEENRLGYIKGGAELVYEGEMHEEKDDLGHVSKIITISETATLKLGLISWNGKTLTKLIDHCKTTDANGKRITKIGGAGNAQGGYYAVCFWHHDPVGGDLWLLIVGRNTAGATLTFATDSGTVIEPEFTAMPQDEDGTLVQLIEETGTADPAPTL